MNSEMQRSGNHLIFLAIPEFSWRHSGKVRNIQSELSIYRERIETGNSGIRVRSVASLSKLLAD